MVPHNTSRAERASVVLVFALLLNYTRPAHQASTHRPALAAFKRIADHYW